MIMVKVQNGKKNEVITYRKSFPLIGPSIGGRISPIKN